MDLSPGVRILYSEPLNAAVASAGAAASKNSLNASRKLQFDAYGKRFEIRLDDNQRLSPLLTQAKGDVTASLKLYQGELEGIAGSWVRLGVRGSNVRGMIWDGAELYVIENAADVAAAMVAPDAPDAGTVIFRLSDTQLDPQANFCANDATTDAQKGDEAYESLIGELKTGRVMMQAADATVRIEIAALGDVQFLERYDDQQEARDEILLRLNNVDGIFSAQLGLEVQVPSVDVKTEQNDPFTSTTSASTLLNQLGKLRKQSPELRSRGLTHLFTGRSLDGTTVGIAYLDSVCQQEYGAGLTEVNNRGSWIESLIAAHEIGHNFGAVHDGQGACSSTAQYSYLMSPSVSGSRSNFSECSLNVMRPRMASASCVVALPPADLAMPMQIATQRHAAARDFDWELTLTNEGGSIARNSRVELLVPAALTIKEAYVPGGTCTSGAGVVFCQLGDVPGGASRLVHLTLLSETAGSSEISATAMAQNDSQASNNSTKGTLTIDPESDVSIALQAPTSVTATNGFQVAYSVTNLSQQDAIAVDITFELPAALSVSPTALPNASCTQQSSAVICKLATLVHGTSASGTLTLVAQGMGSENLKVRVSGSYIDPITSNDSAEQTISIVAAPQVQIQSATPSAGLESGGGGSGGGGSTGGALLAALATLYALRRKSRGSRLPDTCA